MCYAIALTELSNFIHIIRDCGCVHVAIYINAPTNSRYGNFGTKASSSNNFVNLRVAVHWCVHILAAFHIKILRKSLDVCLLVYLDHAVFALAKNLDP